MLACSDFYALLNEAGISSFAGVPDSLLRNFCAYVTDHAPAQAHSITANEGAAVALAAGRYLAGGGTGLVYLQNSGLGNVINPICSLADGDVYSIPMLLLIGWRGEPGVKDEPQHITQGRNMLAVLEAIGVPYEILPPDRDGAAHLLSRARSHMAQHLSPFAIIVRKDTFGSYDLKSVTHNPYGLRRERAMAQCCRSEYFLPRGVPVWRRGLPECSVASSSKAMMEAIIRGLALFLGLSFLLGAFWGPGIQIDGFAGATALLARAVCSERQLETLWALGLSVVGLVAMIVRAGILIFWEESAYVLIGQLSVIALAMLFLSLSTFRLGKAFLAHFGAP